MFWGLVGQLDGGLAGNGWRVKVRGTAQEPMMRNIPRVLLWTDTPGAYIDAIGKAKLADRVAVDRLGRLDMPSDEQLKHTNALLALGVPPGLLPRMPSLRWVQSLTAGVEGWLALPDLPADLTLTSARGTHRESMPENILGALFHITKPFAAVAEDQKQRLWSMRIATPLNGQTLGILGLGAIGQELARLGRALGMRVIGSKRRPTPMPELAELMPAEEVLAQADFVVLLLPATAETNEFINAERLRRMKPSAWLLNFGRGHLIKDDDLIDAVKAGTIAGAMLDVFRQEPLPKEHKFWTTERILVLPHIGGPHPDRDTIVARLFVDNLSRFLDGQPMKEVVDRAAGY
jgi:phosphoglycerate dehydrogenase-like enzyme